jgi:hypothetical protein
LTPLDRWLQQTDPAGIHDDDSPKMESAFCPNCEKERERAVISSIEEVAPVISEEAGRALLKEYQSAVLSQKKLDDAFNEKIRRTSQDLIKNPKYFDFKGLSYSELLLLADIEHVPKLSDVLIAKALDEKEQVNATQNSQQNLSEIALSRHINQYSWFLDGLEYLPDRLKLLMMAGMDHKNELKEFVAELHEHAKSEDKARDEGRAKIKDLASKILQMERLKYKQSFHSKSGNACQKFQF